MCEVIFDIETPELFYPKKIISTGLTGIRSWVVFRLVILSNYNYQELGCNWITITKLPKITNRITTNPDLYLG